MKKGKAKAKDKSTYKLTVNGIRFECLIGNSRVGVWTVDPDTVEINGVMTRGDGDVYAEIETWIQRRLDEEGYGKA